MINPPLDLSKFRKKQPLDLSKFRTQEQINEDPNDHGVTEYLGNLGGFLKEVITNPTQGRGIAQEMLRRVETTRQALPVVASNVVKTGNMVLDAMAQPEAFAGKLIQSLSESDISAGDMAKGAVTMPFKMLIEQPIELTTANKNVDGKPVPSTPAEQAQNIQSVVGTVASFIGAGMAQKALLPALEGEAALAFANKPLLGRVGEVLGKEAIVGAAAGGTQVGIESLGHEDQIAQTLAGVLAGGTLGGMFGLWKAKTYLTEANTKAFEFKTKTNFENSLDLSAATDLKITTADNMESILAKVDALATSDDLVEAAVKARLKINSSTVIENLSDEAHVKLSTQLRPGVKGSINYIPGPTVEGIIKKSRPNYSGLGGIGTEFADSFDKAAVLATSKTSKNGKLILDDIVKQTGLSPEDVVAHGRKVKAEISRGHKENRLQPRTQEEIDALNFELKNEGNSRAVNMVEGATHVDNTGRKWTRTGDMITDGSRAIPLESDLAKSILGRVPRDIEPNAPVVRIRKQDFNTLGIKGSEDYKIYRGARGTTLISNKEIKGEALTTFKESGYVKGELVSYGGKEYSVKGYKNGKLQLAQGKYLKTVDLPDVGPTMIQRTSNLIDTERFDIPLDDFTLGKPKFTGRFDDPSIAKDAIDTELRVIITKNTVPGEQPYRITWMDKETNTPWGHQDYPTLEAARAKGLDEIKTSMKDFNGVEYEKITQAKEKTSKTGLLDNENYFNEMYKKFKAEGWSLNSGANFSEAYYAFTQKMGITSRQDSQSLLGAFYKKVEEDLLNAMDEVDKKFYKETASKLEELFDESSKEQGFQLYQKLYSNGMYIVPEGSGKYSIRFMDSGSEFAKVGTFEEASNLLTKQDKGFDLVGGTSTPNEAYQSVAINQPWQTRQGPKGLHEFNTSSLGYGLAPSARFFESVDARFGTSLLRDVHIPMQRGLTIMKHNIQTKFKVMEDSYNDISKFINKHKITEDELRLVSDYREAKSIPELQAISNKLEDVYADHLVSQKIDVNLLTQFMAEVRSVARDLPANNQKFKDVLLAVTKKFQEPAAKGGYGKVLDPKLMKAANELFANLNQGYDDFSVYNTLRLASAKTNPSLALSRSEFAKVFKERAPLLKELADNYDKTYKSGNSLFGVSEKADIGGNVNNARAYIASLDNPNVTDRTNTRFVLESHKSGYLNRDIIERDAHKLLKQYVMAGVRSVDNLPEELLYPQTGTKGKFISMAEVVERSQDYLEQHAQKFPSDVASNVYGRLERHISDVQGLPRVENDAAKGLSTFAGRLGINSRNISLWIDMAFLGGRPILALRDINTGMINIASMHGEGFAARVFNKTITGKYVKELADKGVINQPKGIELFNPGEDLGLGVSKLSDAASTALELSGQHLVYSRLSAAVYTTTMEDVAKLTSDFTRGLMPKDKLYDKLDIDLLPPPSQKIFDDLISAGKNDQAADFLGRYRIGRVINNYGNFNNPITWNGTWGRMLGRYSSWGVNQAQTMMDIGFQGDPLKRAIRSARFAAYNGAVLAAGASVGLNLWNWMSQPFSLVGIGPIPTITLKAMVQAGTATKDLAFGAMGDSNAMDRGVNKVANGLGYSPFKFDMQGNYNGVKLDQFYIPYGKQTQDFINGYNTIIDNRFGMGAAQAFGFKPIER